MMKLSDVKKGQALSELSTYIVNSVEDVEGGYVVLRHLESNEDIRVSFPYLRDCMSSGHYFDKTIPVGLEDKKYTAKQVEEYNPFTTGPVPQIGELKQKGIRTLFTEIPYKHVFTVTFRKKPKGVEELSLSAKKARFIDAITKAQTSKKGVKRVAEEEFDKFFNEVKSVKPAEGELRTLTGYKLSQQTETGFYICKDLNFPDGDDETKNKRTVNINTITELIIDGTKYVVE